MIAKRALIQNTNNISNPIPFHPITSHLISSHLTIHTIHPKQNSYIHTYLTSVSLFLYTSTAQHSTITSIPCPCPCPSFIFHVQYNPVRNQRTDRRPYHFRHKYQYNAILSTKPPHAMPTLPVHHAPRHRDDKERPYHHNNGVDEISTPHPKQPRTT